MAFMWFNLISPVLPRLPLGPQHSGQVHTAQGSHFLLPGDTSAYVAEKGLHEANGNERGVGSVPTKSYCYSEI